MKHIIHHGLIFFLLLIVCLPVKSQQTIFTKVTLPEGVNLGGIHKVVQDQEGFIWLATVNGLHQYDGHHFISYFNDPENKHTLASDYVTSVFVSKSGLLWIGTKDKGLDLFNPKTKSFKHYPHNPINKNSLSHNYVTSILEDRAEKLWVGTQGGLNRFDPQTGTFIRYLHQPNNAASLSNNVVSALYEDKKGTLWVGTIGNLLFLNEEGGLNRFNSQSNTFTQYKHNNHTANSLLNNKVRAIFEDSRGTFWIGTSGDGLHTMDREKGLFTRHPHKPEQPGTLSRSPIISNNIIDGVTFIHEDVTGVIWIGTYGSGLSRFDPRNNKLVHFVANYSQPGSLQNNYFSSACNSKEGVLWVATYHGGQLYRTDPSRVRITYKKTHARVRSLLEDASGKIWAGTQNGLQVFRPSQEDFLASKKNISFPSQLKNNQVWSLLEDQRGTLWFGSEHGLWRHKPDTKSFKQFIHQPEVATSLNAGIITKLLEDKEGWLWVGTDKGGLSKMNAQTNTFSRFRHEPGNPYSLSNDFVSALYEDYKGNLWVGTWSGFGLNKLNKKNGRFKHYLNNGKSITAIQEDASGRLWVGTSEQGLFLYDPHKDDFIKYIDERTGRQIPYSVKGIIQDNEGYLWVHTTEGLSKIDRNANLITTYGPEMGFLLSEFTLLGTHKGKNGRLYFGDLNGFYTFLPQETNGHKLPPQIQLTSFKFLGGPEGNKTENQQKQSLPLYQTKEIKLRHNQNNFTIDFAGIHFANPDQNSHFYLLENYDYNWREAKSVPTASYFKVPPGNYTFRVKVVSSEGNLAEKLVKLTITPPWWQTWWAYIIYTILFISGLWGFVHFRSRRLRLEKQVLEQKVSDRTVEVIKQKEEISIQRDNLENTLLHLKATQAQLIQSEKMASLGVLTAGIAHEIQNPLNFVNNFSEVSTELLSELEEELQHNETGEALAIAGLLKENLQKINHHGKRADNIVKNMLQHSRTNIGEKQLTDLNTLAKEYMRLSYHGLRAKDKTFNAELITEFSPDLEKIEVIPQDLGRVLLNLFNNAFYATQQKKKQLDGQYQPEVKVSTRSKEGKVEIIVHDNGCGIPELVKSKILQPFFTTKPNGQGTGLGLSLSYDIIKAHGGELKLESKEMEFAEFTIELPIKENI